jgi:hypothetical protein
MTLKRLNALLAATVLGAGVLAISVPADAHVRGCGYRHHWVYASDYAPRRCHSGCVVASDYVAPRTYVEPIYTTPVVTTGWGYGGWGGGGLLGGLWPF